MACESSKDLTPICPHLGELVRGTVEKTLNSMLDADNLRGEEHAFGQRLLGAIKTHCQRFLENAKELPGIQL